MELLKQYLDLAIIGTLGLMSFLMVWATVERLLYFRRVKLGQFSNAEDLNVELTRNLTTIASVGSNAPYVGLLGTVMGILITFYDLSHGGNIDTNSIMLGLSLALKATALGLFVAIPSIAIYNGLLRKVDVLTARWKQETGQ